MPSLQASGATLGLVTRRPGRRPLPTGLLSASTDGFAFSYVRGFTSDPTQRPLLGFSSTTQRYLSPLLFPFFQQRVLEADRSDRTVFLQWLGLAEDASDWQVLARGGGTRKGDPFELIAAPDRAASGGATARVLARGLRFMGQEVGFNRLEAGLSRLTAGAALRVELDAGNLVNPAARRLLAADGTPLGWIPDVLVSYLAPRQTDVIKASVAQINGPDVPWHVRLLIDLEVPSHPPTPLFATEEWQSLAPTRTEAEVV